MMSSKAKDAVLDSDVGADTPSAKALAAEVLKLPLKAREEIAETLRDPMEDSDEDPNEVEAAWEKELLRRSEDVKTGRVKTVPWTDVLAGIDQIVNGKRET